MRRYLQVLSNRQFAALWYGSTASAIGDALTWVALVWLILEADGPAALGGLVVAYTAPVIVGGLVMGVLLDRFERRRVLIAVNTVLGCSVAAVPLLSGAGLLETWHLYVVAGLYGLLKMANWAGVPSLIPSLVPDGDLNTANAMESVSFGIAEVAGPALAGVLIGIVGGASVLVVDAASYLLFVVVLAGLRVPPEPAAAEEAPRSGLRPAFRFVRRQPAVLAITLMFMAFNVGEGMLLVLLPIFARRELGGDAATYGALLSSFALAVTAGSFVVGALEWRWTLGRSIATAQVAAGLAFLGLAAAPSLPAAIAVLVVAGALVSPMTIWAQTVRMRVIPPELRGRTFGLPRTLMQSTPPLGGAVAAAMLVSGRGIGPVVVATTLVMAVPGVVGLFTPALADEHTRAKQVVAGA
jgi:MFS family permease